ncbi:MAG: SusD/RagB family nutrient-binding outer membrane lipoprotein [Saprospiraceae bacterium]
MKKILLGALSLLLLASCGTDSLKELNINPQAPSTINMNFLMTSAQLGTASGGSRGDNRYIDWRTNIGMCAHAIQHIANTGASIAPGDKYNQDNGETNAAPWDFLYNDVLQNLAEISRQTGPGGFEAGQRKNMREAARILRAYNYMRLTDYYGNIPYEEAGKGITEGIFFPKYTAQSVIYPDLMKEISSAVSAISTSNPDDGFGKADLFYQGDIAKWKKFGNSLLLRLAMRVSNVDPAMAKTYAAQAIAGGVMTAQSDRAMIKTALGPSEWTNQNGISRAFANGDGGQQSCLSKTLVDFLKNNSDPRLMIISGGVGGVDQNPANQKGCPNGLDATTLDVYTGKTGSNLMIEFSIINPKLLDDDEDYVFMDLSEVELLQAEAAERGIAGSDAAGHFAKGVKAAIQQYTHYDASLAVSDAMAQAYVDAHPYKGGAAGLEQIGTQLWAAKFLNWWDAWADWRRTGFPKLVPVVYQGNLTNGTIPRKLKVPNGELATNQANFQAGGTLPNEYTTKVWWDK